MSVFAVLTITVALAMSMSTLAQNTAPRLVAQTADGRTTYHVGERIPLQLSFTGPNNKRYQVNMATYDRSGRMSYEKFAVTPDSGWADPLETYFRSSLGYFGGGLASIPYLSHKPEVVLLNLNEWVRFDQPGLYKIVVMSNRVSDMSVGAAQRFLRGSTVALQSNSIRIRIVPPTKDWQSSKLASIEAALTTPPGKSLDQQKALQDAIADLRYLGTPDAIKVMSQHLREDQPALMWQCAFGLMGVPDNFRPAALSALSQQIDNSDFPISSLMLETMSVLQVTSGTPAEERQQRQQMAAADWELALQSLSTKEGKARAATVQTLLSWQFMLTTPQRRAELGRALAANLMALPAQQQANDLEWQWDLLRSQEILPLLKQFAETSLENVHRNAADFYNTRDLKAAALRRWYELDPEGAQQEILRQIGTPNPSLTADSLSFLPANEKMPQFEYLWAGQFASTDDYDQQALLAGLMTRFGEGDAVALVEAKAEAHVGKWACEPQAAALGYLVKFDPEDAALLLHRALNARQATGCYHSLFTNIAHYASGPVLTTAALASLEDPDQQATMDALSYLTSFGDVSAKQPIWNRYLEWSNKWQGRANMLEDTQPGNPQDNWKNVGLGMRLVSALLENQGWLADAALIARVQQHCVGFQVCQESRQIAAQAGDGQHPYTVSVSSFGQSQQFQIAQYNIKSLRLLDTKVAQFPRGTRFVLISTTPNNSDQQKLTDKVQAIFKKHGLVLQQKGRS